MHKSGVIRVRLKRRRGRRLLRLRRQMYVHDAGKNYPILTNYFFSFQIPNLSNSNTSIKKFVKYVNSGLLYSKKFQF